MKKLISEVTVHYYLRFSILNIIVKNYFYFVTVSDKK